jgi:hypothetical protein
MTSWSIAWKAPSSPVDAGGDALKNGFDSGRLALFALIAALLLQGAAGRPAPPILRPEIEGVIALLLCAAVGLRRPWGLFCGGAADDPPWAKIGAVCLLLLFWLPLCRAAWMGRGAGEVLRDVAPLLFLFLPLALVPALRPAGRFGVMALAAALMLEGLFYSLRWWNHMGWGFGALGVRVLPDGGGYLLNAPSALFAAIAWPLTALWCLEKGGLRGLLGAVAALIAGALCVAAQLGAAHRLAVGFIVAAGLAAVWTRASRLPWLIPLLAVAVLTAAAVEGERLSGALFYVAEKTRLAGANARFEEAAAALSQAGDSAASALLGDGWGAEVENPAVGGWRVAYTHTFATYLLVKAGAVGLAAMLVWLGALSPAAGRLWRADPAWALAVLAPLLTAFTVHTSYKYLDTGVLLTLMVLAAGEKTPVRETRERV